MTECTILFCNRLMKFVINFYSILMKFGIRPHDRFSNLTSFLRCFDEIYFAFNWRNSRLISVMFENVRFYHMISNWKSQFCLNRSTKFSINSVLVLRNLWFHYILDDIRYFLRDLLKQFATLFPQFLNEICDFFRDFLMI